MVTKEELEQFLPRITMTHHSNYSAAEAGTRPSAGWHGIALIVPVPLSPAIKLQSVKATIHNDTFALPRLASSAASITGPAAEFLPVSWPRNLHLKQ